MKAVRAFVRRLHGLFAKKRLEREISAELESHLELHVADNLDAGMPPQEALRAALMKLGGWSAAKEAYRDRSTLPLLENVLLDLRFAARQFGRNPAFAATAVIVLSLGICAASAIFAFVDAALLKPMPYKDPARLVAVDESSAMFQRSNLSYFDYLDWKRLNKAFASLDVYTGAGYLLKTSDGVKPVNAATVSADFFETLAITPVLGRTFQTGEELSSASNGCVYLRILAETVWRETRRHWPHSRAQRRTVHNHRRAACELSVCTARQCRTLDTSAPG